MEKNEIIPETNYKLYVFCRLSRNQPTGLCYHLFAMIQTCTYLYSSNFTPQLKQARNLLQIFNRKSISRNTTHRQSLDVRPYIDSLLKICDRFLAYFSCRVKLLNYVRNQRPFPKIFLYFVSICLPPVYIIFMYTESFVHKKVL